MSDDPQGQEPTDDSEPDVRFTYANERTFLAWNRTALALIATGVAATQLLPEFHVRGGRQILGIPLIALGTLVAITSFMQWRANELAMRQRRPLPKSPMALVLAIGIAVISVVAVVLVIHGPEIGAVADDRGRGQGAPPGAVDPVGVAEVWDEGLSPQRTELAWGRTGLALVAAVVVLARRAWALGGGFEVAAIVVVAVGGLVWLAGMRLSRDLHAHMEPHGLTGTRAFALVTTGTVLLAVGASVFGVLAPTDGARRRTGGPMGVPGGVPSERWSRRAAGTDGDPMIEHVVEQWHRYLKGDLPGGLDELLHDDVVFYSPIVFTPQRGKAITARYLQAAAVALPGDKSSATSGGGIDPSGDGGGGFRYTKKVLDGDTAALEFETTIDGKYVNGVDIIRCDDAGLIVEFRVMIRPLQAVNAVHRQMGETLEKMQSQA